MVTSIQENDALKSEGVDDDWQRVQEDEEEPPGDTRRRLIRQFGLVTLTSLGYFNLGAVLPWPSPALSNMLVNNKTLVNTEINLTSAEKDMTGSLVYLGTLFGAWFAGWMVSKLGRKRSLQLVVVPYILGWIITALAPTAPVLLIGRTAAGIAAGATTISGYAYVIEISDKTHRGMMASIPTMGIVLGGFYTVLLGYVLQWQYLTLVCAVPPVLFLLGTFLLPESPSYLVIKGRRHEAMMILRKLRGNHVDIAKEVTELEKMNSAGQTDVQYDGWRGLLKLMVLRRIATVVILFLLMQLSGNFVFMIYTARVLEATGAPMDPDAIAAIAGALKIGGTLAAILLLDRIGRRVCLIISHAINAMCLILLGTYVYMAEAAAPEDETYSRLSWVPTVCVTVSLFFCDIGVHPVPYILSSEYFPTNIRAQASSVCISVGTLITFSVLQAYTPMQEVLTQAGLYWFYGATSVVGVVFSCVAVTETMGKNVG